MGVRAGARRRGADPVGRPGRGGRHEPDAGRAVARALGRHRQPGPRHPRPRAGGDAAVGRAGALPPRRSRSASGSRSGAGADARSAVAPDACITGRRQHRGRLPGPAAGALLRGHLRGRCRRAPCWPSAWPGRPPFARLCQTLIASVGARDFVTAARIAGVGRGPDPAAPRAAQHRGAARRQRDDRRRCARCWRSPGSRSSGSASSRPPTTGAGCSRTASARSTSSPAGALAPGLAIVVAGLAFNLFGEADRQGLRHRRARSPAAPVPRRGADARSRHATASAGAAGPATARPAATPVLDVRDLEVTFPTEHGADPTGPRRDSSRSRRARRSASSASRARASR